MFFNIFLVVFLLTISNIDSSHGVPKLRNSRLRSNPNSFRVVTIDIGRFTGRNGQETVIVDVEEPVSLPTTKYEPTWESLDARPLPKWYDQSKIGIFIHWGVFSVPSFGSEWFWKFWQSGRIEYLAFMANNYRPGFTYQDFGPQFTAEFFDPHRWADIFKKSGAKYVVLTSKHHEGFTLWPSKYSFGWNAMDIGPKRDLVGQLAAAIRNTTNIKFGLYHSLFEWFNPLFLQDQANNFTTNDFVNSKTLKELYEIVAKYEPEIIWSDGDPAPDEYWQSKEFLTWLYNDSPVKNTVVTNDRWGQGTSCKHGGYYSCNDRYNPGVLIPHKWENCMTLDKASWGYRRNAKVRDYLTPEELISTVVETVSCGGNALVNVGPTKEGIIPPIMEERLTQLGEWLEINGEAIYGTKAWIHQNDTVTPRVWYTQSQDPDDTIYAIILNWPSSLQIQLGCVNAAQSITLLGSAEGSLQWTPSASKGIIVELPSLAATTSQWAWTLAIK